MSAHSKFKTIMHRKGAQDKKKSKIFAKLSREITISARTNSDPDFNPRLRVALVMARTHNMPKDRIQAAIQKAAGGDKSDDLLEIRYEGYGPNGAAVIVEALTDNRNRTATDVRTAFSKNGGQIGELGSVSYMFDHVGYIVYKNKKIDDVMEVALNNDAKDVEESEDGIEIIVDLENFSKLREACLKTLGDPEEMEVMFMPQNTVTLPEDKKNIFYKMIDVLEDLDDVQNVFHNVE